MFRVSTGRGQGNAAGQTLVSSESPNGEKSAKNPISTAKGLRLRDIGPFSLPCLVVVPSELCKSRLFQCSQKRSGDDNNSSPTPIGRMNGVERDAIRVRRKSQFQGIVSSNLRRAGRISIASFTPTKR